MKSLSNSEQSPAIASGQSLPVELAAKPACAPVLRSMEEVMASSMPREVFLLGRLDSIRDFGSLFVVAPVLVLTLGVICCASGGDIFNASLWKPALASVGMEVSSMVLALFGFAFFHLSCETIGEKLDVLDFKRARALGMALPEFMAARAKFQAQRKLAKEKLADSRAKAKKARDLLARGF